MSVNKVYMGSLGIVLVAGTLIACGFKSIGFGIDTVDVSKKSESVNYISADQIKDDDISINKSTISKLSDLVIWKTNGVKHPGDLKYVVSTKDNVTFSQYDDETYAFVVDSSVSQEESLVFSVASGQHITGQTYASSGTEKFIVEIIGLDKDGSPNPDLWYDETITDVAAIDFYVPDSISTIKINVKSDSFATAIFTDFIIK